MKRGLQKQKNTDDSLMFNQWAFENENFRSKHSSFFIDYRLLTKIYCDVEYIKLNVFLYNELNIIMDEADEFHFDSEHLILVESLRCTLRFKITHRAEERSGNEIIHKNHVFSCLSPHPFQQH